MAVPHISNIKYKGFHPIDKRKTIKIINKFIDNFNKINESISLQSLTIWGNFCKQLEEKVENSSLFYHRNYLIKFIGYATSKASNKINKEEKLREENFKECIKSSTTNPKLTLDAIQKRLEKFYGRTGIEGYEKSAINKLKDYNDQLMAITFLKMKGFLREQQTKKINELQNDIAKLIKDIEKKYPADHSFYQKANKVKQSLEQLMKILSGKTSKLSKEAHSCLTECISKNRNAEKILNSSKPLMYAPFPKCDITTNKIIISFMGMITDDGVSSRPEATVKTYIESK